MWERLLELVQTALFWKYATIPLISGVVGWITNVIALKMTFYPLDFVGVWKIGWQGIIPSKAGVMAGKAVDLLTEKLITIEDRFEQIEPERVAEEMEPSLNRLATQIVNETMEAEAPEVWENMPVMVRNRLFQRMSNELPEVVEDLMQEIKNDISVLFDLRAMVVDALESDRNLLNDIFLRVGEKEFQFIERSGLYFGFLFGIFQMSFFVFLGYLGWPSGWVLPAAGLFVGWATNVLALRLIFQPLRPTAVGPFIFQGLFIRRQMEVSEEYARIVSRRILTSRNIFERMITGPASDRLATIIQSHVKGAIDAITGMGKPFFQLATGTRQYVDIKNRIAQRFVEELPHSVRHMFAYAEEALDIENTLKTRMQGLVPLDFVGFLRPVFQEDEWKLILVGAVLGFLAGLAQLMFVFADTLVG
ncbi:MAG: hypothetical protein D6722_25825 [Bacteroidetes bacterium]|nr:MAG: hypothetical protein D6722_25825 [Bacteroidota bacterium]